MFACVGNMWAFLHVPVNKSSTHLLSCFQEKKTFHMGPWYPLLPTPAKKWCSVFVANPCFLSWLRPPGKENTFYRQAWETPWQNRLQTLCADTEMPITSVFSVPPSRLSLLLSVIICHFVLGIICCSIWMFKCFPWVVTGKEKSCQHFL